MTKIIFATQNAGKLKEIKQILSDYEVLSMKEAKIDIDIEETGKIFEENAKIKAEELTKYTDYIVLADDSGLEVDYLNKEPGIYSARYLGENTPQVEKNQSILDRLGDVPTGERTARFVCAIAIAKVGHVTKVVRGTMEGYIGKTSEGTHGFGYDPIFCLQNGTPIATLEREQKNAISHRGQALQLIKKEIKNYI
ncbi:MAG: non-canonical purine NTP pyrophosphatase, RdgB/HAM1 family [Epulopiscium sp. Nele67-Bin004]|nr:MAG: non-canonical purine NTP pyrophosphatase, RdgB/HAM1 family [Epulopiscium sp. Nele67-Bin004]